jgi:hypothetical protein
MAAYYRDKRRPSSAATLKHQGRNTLDHPPLPPWLFSWPTTFKNRCDDMMKISQIWAHGIVSLPGPDLTSMARSTFSDHRSWRFYLVLRNLYDDEITSMYCIVPYRLPEWFFTDPDPAKFYDLDPQHCLSYLLFRTWNLIPIASLSGSCVRDSGHLIRIRRLILDNRQTLPKF